MKSELKDKLREYLSNGRPYTSPELQWAFRTYSESGIRRALTLLVKDGALTKSIVTRNGTRTALFQCTKKTP